MKSLGWILCSCFLVGSLVVVSGCDQGEASDAAATDDVSPAADVAVDVKADSEDELPLPPCCQGKEDAAADVAPTTQPAADTVADKAEAPVDDDHPVARLSPWIEPAERLAFDLDYDVTSQDGKSMKLSDLKGKPFVLSWVYTRCPDPQMCPLITSHFSRLQQEVAVAGLGEKVNLVLLSYDPAYDTPARMKAYGKLRGLKFDGIPTTYMFRPSKEQFRSLLSEFQVTLMPQTNGEFSHVYELIIADEQGRFVRDHQGQLWSNEQVVDDLKKILEEAKAEKTASAE